MAGAEAQTETTFRVVRVLDPGHVIMSGGLSEGVTMGRWYHAFQGQADDREGLFFPGPERRYLGDLPVATLQVFDRREHFAMLSVVAKYQTCDVAVGDLVVEVPGGAPIPF